MIARPDPRRESTSRRSTAGKAKAPYRRRVAYDGWMTDSAELRARLETGIRELEGDIAKLRAAITALGGHAPARTPRKSRGRTRTAPKPEPVVVPAGKLSTLLSGSDGITTTELARQTGGAPDQVLQMLKELEQAGKARRSGARRTTRWHAGGGSPKPAKPARQAAKAAKPAAKAAKAAKPAKPAATKPDSEASKRESEAQIASALDSVVAS
jgi:hypothetical protein